MRLILQFLGLPQLYIDKQPVATDRRKAIALLAYLAVNDLGHTPQKYSRETLSALMWPDYEQAKAFSNLRRTIWEVHQALGENWLIANRETVQLNPDVEIDLDVARFQDLLLKSRQPMDANLRIPLLVDTVKLYRNHFLTGFILKDAYPFNEWAFAVSEELRRKLADSLTLLVESHCALNQDELAIPYARRLISLDPLNESAHRQLMEVYLRAGQSNEALKQYRTCEQIFRKELNLDPQPETRALYKQILKGENKNGTNEKNADPPEKLEPKHNLPLHLTTFVGREKERDEICNLVVKNRLITLIGVGGIGKTRLAIEAAKYLLPEYSHGVWLISLDSLVNPALVSQTIASTFNIREGSERSINEQLITFLHEKSTLLIFDNCEHLLDACAQIINILLKNCPDLKILATSREVIGVEGECTYITPALSVPEAQHIESAEELTRYESLQLFNERAQLCQMDFSMTMKNATSIIQICQRLDGIPLAIELAAARVNMLSTEQISKRLNESFNLLTGGSRNTLPRHQTLRASIDWSWELLSESEQTLLQRLAVFAGGWTLDAAESVCNEDNWDVLDLLSNLVEKSFVFVDKNNERYRMLETIHQYASEKFLKMYEIDLVQQRHCAWVLAWAEKIGLELRERDQVTRLKEVRMELDNARAATEWGLRTGQAESSMRIVTALSHFWDGNNYQESREWLEKGISYRDQLSKSTLAKALAEAVWLAYRQNDSRAGVPYAEQCLVLAEELEDPILIARALRCMTLMKFLTRDFIEAERYSEKGSLFCQKIGDKKGLAFAVSDHVLALAYQGNITQAVELHEDYQGLVDNLDLSQSAYFQLVFGGLRVLQGEFEQARPFLKSSLLLYHQINNTYFIGNCLIGFAGLANGYKKPMRAAQLLGAREAIHESIGTKLDPGLQDIYTSLFTQIRSVLSESAFASAWAKGHRMTIKEAIDYALDENRD